MIKSLYEILDLVDQLDDKDLHKLQQHIIIVVNHRGDYKANYPFNHIPPPPPPPTRKKCTCLSWGVFPVAPERCWCGAFGSIWRD